MWILIILIAIIALVVAGKIDNKRAYDKELKPYEQKNNAMASIKCNHITGLLLAESKECIVSFCSDKIVIESNNQVFKLDLSKIIDMNIKTTQEIQNSISDAAMGYFLFGTLGAAALGSVKQTSRVFIIIYKDKKDEDKCITLDLGNDLNNLKYTNNYVEAFNEQILKAKEIEL